MNTAAADFKRAKIDERELLSLQVLDINVCRRSRSGHWHERPSKKTFDLKVAGKDIVTRQLLGHGVPVLRPMLAKQWLERAYGAGWETPLRPNLHRRVVP